MCVWGVHVCMYAHSKHEDDVFMALAERLIYMYIYVCVCGCVCVCAYLCVCVCMYVCMNIRSMKVCHYGCD